MKIVKTKIFWQNCGLMVGGTFIFAIACNCFIVPSSLNNSGIIGLAQIIQTMFVRFSPFHIGVSSIGIINFLLNLPLLFLAWKMISKKFFSNTLFCVVTQTVFLTIIPIMEVPLLADKLSNAVIGGIIAGVGSGFMLRAGSCSGGIDILGVYLTMKLRAFSIGKLSISFNTMIYIACALLFDVQIAIYSVIYSYFMSQMVDKIHFQNIKMSVTVFTKKPLIDKALTHGLHRGVTYWKGNGGYTDENTFVIMTIVSKQEVNKLKEIVHQHDPNAFVIFNEGLNIDGNFEKRLA